MYNSQQISQLPLQLTTRPNNHALYMCVVCVCPSIRVCMSVCMSVCMYETPHEYSNRMHSVSYIYNMKFYWRFKHDF